MAIFMYPPSPQYLSIDETRSADAYSEKCEKPEQNFERYLLGPRVAEDPVVSPRLAVVSVADKHHDVIGFDEQVLALQKHGCLMDFRGAVVLVG